MRQIDFTSTEPATSEEFSFGEGGIVIEVTVAGGTVTFELEAEIGDAWIRVQQLVTVTSGFWGLAAPVMDSIPQNVHLRLRSEGTFTQADATVYLGNESPTGVRDFA